MPKQNKRQPQSLPNNPELINAICGIDASLRNTAICIRKPNRSKADIVHITTRTDAPLWDTILYIHDRSAEIIHDSGSNPLCIIERPALLAKGASIFQIFAVNTAIRMAMRRASLPWLEISPMQLKKYCTGNGNSQKQMVMLNVFKRFGFEPEDDNEADAFVLSEIGCALLGWTSPSTAYQKAILQSIIGG